MRPKKLEQFEDAALLSGEPQGSGQTDVESRRLQRDWGGTIFHQRGDLLGGAEIGLMDNTGFAVNAETGLQPLQLGYAVKEVPISWINRAPDMGASSFRLVRVGGGYWRVLGRTWKQGCASLQSAVASGEGLNTVPRR